MIETLHAYGKKLSLQGIQNPLEQVKQAYEYDSVEEAKSHIRIIGEEIKQSGLPAPAVFGFTGYGNVSQAAQEILDLLPVVEIIPDDLSSQYELASRDTRNVYKVVFREEHIVKRKTGDFELQDYYNHPENYTSCFTQFLPFLSVVVNCIFWTEDYPRLITREYLSRDTQIPLIVIGDISVDIEGSIEITNKATYPDKACYTFDPAKNTYEDGIADGGISIMAIDNLPCEFPRESSAAFSEILKRYIPEILNADYHQPMEDLELSYPIKKALILKKGVLTTEYQYMEEFLR